MPSQYQAILAALTFLPILLCIAAIILRSIGISQADDSVHFLPQKLILGLSYILFGQMVIAIILLIIFYRPGGVISILVSVLLLATYSGSAIRTAGTKRRSQQAEFLWVLATAAKSGRPLAGEIEAYANGLVGQRHKLIMTMADRLRSGMPLTELLVHPGLLPTSASMQITTGISTQTLEQTLSQAAIRATHDLTEEYSSDYPGFGLAYPPILVVITSLQVGFLMFYIIPKFKKIFDDFGTELPNITRFLIQISDRFYGYWPILALPVLVYIPIGICLLIAAAEYYGWQVFLTKYFGRWFVRLSTPDILRALSRSLASNIPLERVLDSLATAAATAKLRGTLAKAQYLIEDGADNWQVLERVGILKHREAVLLEVAQRNGNLPWALELLATSIEQRRAFRLNAFLEFLKPLYLLLIGLNIAFVIIALFMPLVKLLNDLS